MSVWWPCLSVRVKASSHGPLHTSLATLGVGDNTFPVAATTDFPEDPSYGTHLMQEH